MLARSTAPPISFAAGWVQVDLRPCPGATERAGPGALEVEGSRLRLRFRPGRPGGGVIGVLAAQAQEAPAGAQRFASPGAGRGRTVVLAPWDGAGPAPAVGRIRLLAR